MATQRQDLDLRAVPARLRKIGRWLVWRYVTRDGKPTKVPFSATDGRAASATDPATWSTFDQAVAAFKRGGYAGVGFVFCPDDRICGIDLDNCIAESGELEPWAQQIVDRVASYTEISPSGRGVKLWALAKLPPGRRRKGKIEMYETGRYFTITGQHLSGTPATIEERQTEVDAVHAEVFGAKSPRTPPRPVPVTRSSFASDDELVEKARAAKNGAKFSALFDHGDTSGHDGDHSAADLALCSYLAFWAGGDPVTMDRIFRRSARLRPKWDERRGESTYGERTIQAALRGATEFYEPQQQRTAARHIEPGDTTEVSAPPASAPAAEEAMQELWALGSDPEPTAVAATLQRVAAALDGADPLTIQTARAVAMRALKGKLPNRDKLVDAALTGVGTQARPSPRPGQTTADLPYRATEDGLVQLKQTKEGEVPVLLTNFTARIVTDVARDDGAEVRRSFEIEARHHKRVHRFEVSAPRFTGMTWVTEKLGATAVLSAGFGTRDHARAAIQSLSDSVRTRTLYTHVGWRRIDKQWCYLHAGGAIGPVGPVPDVETDLPQQLRLYHLPAPVGGDELVRAVRASLRIVDLLPDAITVPVYGATWRAVLGPSDHSVHLLGATGEGKSELAARAQQHFGPGLDARHLPAAWSSTANSLEVIAFSAMDALLTIDDFAPEGTTFDIQRQHREAARLLRAQGNNAGRSRLRPDGELRPSKWPRGLILSTGEDVPGGQSVRARNFVLEVPAGGMDWDLLSRCQADGAEGLYAQAMTGFLVWVAGRYEELTELRPRRLKELRSLATASGQHRRTPSIVADIAFGLETFLRFARDVGALSESDALERWERSWAALGEAAAAQVEHVASADPTRRFLELLGSAIASGRVHVVSAEGTEPEAPRSWGWRERTIGTGNYAREEWQPLGNQIGWLSEGQLYLEPDAAYKAAQGAATVEGLSVQPRTLWKRLKEKGLLVRTDEKRKRNVVRETLQGVRREVLHLRPGTLLAAETSQTSQTSHEVEEPPHSGPILWDVSGSDDGETSHRNVPETPVDTGAGGSAGTIGPIGTFSDTRDPDGWEDV